MKEYVLSYYPKFKCIAEKCQHTCCAGWEINIDEQSLIKYEQCVSNFSHTLKKGINFKKSKFKSDKFKRCAFLNDDGLCELLINLGEKNLCQVCADHPRFRSFFNDRTETGLGFCCEEASRIILSYKDKIEPMLINDDEIKTELDFNQKNVLDFRNEALQIIQDRTICINERIENLLKKCKANIQDKEFKKILKTFLSFEKIDKNWSKRLKNVDKDFNKRTEENLSIYCEQFLVNSIYRHLSDAEDTIWVRARAIACVFSWWIVKSVIKKELTVATDIFDLTVDVVREFSTEVEYSQKNLNKLFSLSYKFIKI